MRRYALWFLCLFLASGLASADKLILKGGSGKALDIVVLEETYEGVSYYLKGDTSRSKQTFEWKQIQSVEYEDKPVNYQYAEDAFAVQKYDTAIKNYIEAASALEKLKQHCLFKIAECYRLQGNYAKALQQYNALLKEFEKTIYFAQARIAIGHCYLALGKKYLKNAEKAFSDAAAACAKLSLVDGELESLYWVAYTAEKQETYPAAEKGYNALLKRVKKGAPLEMQVRLGHARCLLGNNQLEPARAAFLEMIKTGFRNEETPDEVLLAAGYLGLGQYYFKMKNPDEALLCFLRVILLYQGDEETLVEAYDKAAYCFDLLKNKGPEYRARANALRVEVQSRFPHRFKS